MFRGVILDVDGTLVDSNDAHARAWQAALAENGFKVPFDEVRRQIGMGGDKLLPNLTGQSAESAAGKRISQLREEIFQKEYLPKIKPLPGARDLLRHMHGRGLRLAVASSAKDKELKELLKICGADEVIEACTSSDDAERSKPDPDIVIAALEKIDLPLEQVVMLGDTPYDVAAASRAGIRIIALRCGGWSDADLAGALAIYDNPQDLLSHYEDSPLAS